MNNKLDNLITNIKIRLYEGIPKFWITEYLSNKKTYKNVKLGFFASAATIVGLFFLANHLQNDFLGAVIRVFGIIYSITSFIFLLIFHSMFKEFKEFNVLIKQLNKLNNIAAYEFCEQHILPSYINNDYVLSNFESTLNQEELQILMTIPFNKEQLEFISILFKDKKDIKLSTLLCLKDIKEKEYALEQYNDIFNQFAQENNLKHNQFHNSISVEKENEISYKKYL